MPDNRSAFETTNIPTWCPGCGNYTILASLKRALVEKKIKSHEFTVLFDIGCGSNMADFISTYAFRGLHGRVVPLAVGAALALRQQGKNYPVLAIGGDGGIYGEGLGHLIAAARNNYPVFVIVSNNLFYSLTTGQSSPTTPQDYTTKTSGVLGNKQALNPLDLLIGAGAGWVAQGFAGDVLGLTRLVAEGLDYPGFRLLNVLMPCAAWDKKRDMKWYRERVLSVTPAQTIALARKLVGKTTNIPVGVLWKM